MLPLLLMAALGVTNTQLHAVERASEQVSSYYGSLSHAIAFEVPAFRGLEPSLALAYSSEAGGGLAGVGWSVTGFGTVERVSPGRGAPRWLSDDVFLLNGAELVPCAGITSPSCSSGGTHTTKLESYQRVTFDAGANTWTVWAKNGTRTVYAPTFTTANGVLRWGVSQVIDTLGNTVNHRWTTLDGVPYPQAVIYGPYQVSLFWEPRPDSQSFATGGSLATLTQRLRSVIAYIPGQTHIRGYQLRYATSPLTGRSQLTEVQQYGKDLVHDVGAISAGTALPPQRFSYTDDPAGKTFVVVDAIAASASAEPVRWAERVKAGPVDAENNLEKLEGAGGPGDWDAGASSTCALAAGDGALEFTASERYTWGKMVGLSNGDTDASPQDIDFALYEYYDNQLYAYENGTFYGPWWRAEGDTLRVEVVNGQVRYLRNGSVLHTSTRTPTYPLRADAAIRTTGSTLSNVRLTGNLIDVNHWCAGETALSGDVDGDGRTDQLCYDASTGITRVARSLGDRFAAPVAWLTNQELERPLVADFDADGKDDLAEFEYQGGTFNVARSTGSAFAAMALWGTAFAYDENGSPRACKTEYAVPGTGDFNGDGKLDVSCRIVDPWHPAHDGNVLVGISSGSAFTFGHWGNLGCDWSGYQRTGAIDFDGDSKDDWLCIGSDSGDLQVYVSTGSGFLWPNYGSLGSAFCGQGATHTLGDFNADGRTDVACGKRGKLALSTGKGFAEQGANFGTWCNFDDDQLLALDVDGDRAAELVCNHKDAGANDLEVRKWSNGALGAAAIWKASWCDGKLLPGDYSGDAKIDLDCTANGSAYASAGTVHRWADLMASHTAVLGGVTTFAFVSSATFSNANNPPVRPVVASVIANDGRSAPSTTSYAYEGGYMDRVNREFLGFRHVTATLPCLLSETQCPTQHTWFQQTPFVGALVEKSERRAGNGVLFTASENTYAIQTASVPYQATLTQTLDTTTDGTGIVCVTWPCEHDARGKVSYVYDSYGNVTQTIEHGDADVPGDERNTILTYVPNTGAYIVDRVAQSELRDGTLASGNLLTRTRTRYDGAASWNVAPAKGLPTAEDRWLDTINNYVVRTTGYDTYGNAITSSDETGRTSTSAFDPSDHLFPVSASNAANETSLLAWDRACVGVSQATDPNGQVTTTTRDALCRVSRVDRPLGGYTATRFVNTGSPTTQYVQTDTPPGDPADRTPNWSRTYMDGFGRSYHSERRGHSAAQVVAQDTAFNTRGGVANATEPYVVGASTAPLSRFAYDALDRRVRTRLPDNALIIQSYGLRSSTTTDPVGQPTTVHLDAYGRIVSTDSSFAGRTLVTTRRYDARGNLVEVRDPLGNAWTWTFDSLGRQTQQLDPDSGKTDYTFDAAGRLLTQTDAKGQVTTLAYDPAGRLASRSNAAGTASFAYSENRGAAYANVGRLTTMSDPHGSATSDYDAQGNLVRQTRTLDETVYTMTHRFDAAGRWLGTTYPDGDVIGSAADPVRYDGAGHMRSIPGLVAAVSYDASARVTGITNANGTVTTRTLNPNRGWIDAIVTTNGATKLQDLAYARDANGRITLAYGPNPDESWEYTYDALGRLTNSVSSLNTANNQSFQYDDVGNVIQNSRIGAYTYPSAGAPRPHAPSAVAGQPMTYDANGNLTAGRGRSIVWNADNRPTSVNGVQFRYDGHGSRLSKTALGMTSRYPFGDDYEITNGTTTKYVSLPGVGLVAKRVGNQSFWLHTDQLGSVHVVTDASGADVLRKTYRPYGDKINDSSSHTESRGWIDQRQDAETGLTHLHARDYDAGLGLFVSPDSQSPIDPGVGTNRFAYALGDPINLSDRSGSDAKPCKEVQSGRAGKEKDSKVACSEEVTVVATTEISDGTVEIVTTVPAARETRNRVENGRRGVHSRNHVENRLPGVEIEVDVMIFEVWCAENRDACDELVSGSDRFRNPLHPDFREHEIDHP
jgi:RHS repeat-associated protein